MIIFDLACNNGHRFEGWFQSLESFEQQCQADLVSCPHCGSLQIQRVPSAVHVGKSSPEKSAGERLTALRPHGKLLDAYRNLLAEIIAGSEDVGTGFASEARKIHASEAPARSIRGQATAEEFESLIDEGIEVFRFPVFDNDDLN